ncbi:hypothetical protein K3495_g9459 [Podosphaera aphanis]|nr:hypothetical protein K3495_g9459 [Podosphaera aphanis]
MLSDEFGQRGANARSTNKSPQITTLQNFVGEAPVMESTLIRRPLHDLFLRPNQCFIRTSLLACRYQSSYRRTRSRLNVKPESSFLISDKSPKQDHIIFNPPSSAPSVFHTPFKFVPQDDKRRKLLAATLNHFGQPETLPPPMRPKQIDIPRGHLNPKDIAEIKRLNNRDPNLWTNKKLAKKFNCSSEFVSVCLRHAGGNPSARKELIKSKLEYVESKWGPRRMKAKEDRQKRWQAALRDE